MWSELQDIWEGLGGQHGHGQLRQPPAGPCTKPWLLGTRDTHNQQIQHRHPTEPSPAGTDRLSVPKAGPGRSIPRDTAAAQPQHHPQGLVLPPRQCHPQRQQAQQPSSSRTRTHGPALQCQSALCLYSSREKQPLPQRHRGWHHRAPAQQHPAAAAATAAATPAGQGTGSEGRGHQHWGPGDRSEGCVLLGNFGVSASESVGEKKQAHHLV